MLRPGVCRDWRTSLYAVSNCGVCGLGWSQVFYYIVYVAKIVQNKILHNFDHLHVCAMTNNLR